MEQTYRDLEALAPMVETMAVVPVGITKHREHLTPMRLFSKPEAAAIVDKVTVWQQECREKFQSQFFISIFFNNYLALSAFRIFNRQYNLFVCN